MSVYMVERSLGGITMEQLAAAQRSAIDTAAQMSREAAPVRYIRSTLVPESGQCQCLFEAATADTIVSLNHTAGLPFDRIVAALDLTP